MITQMSNKDKLITLWKQACLKETSRMRAEKSDFYNIPSKVRSGCSESAVKKEYHKEDMELRDGDKISSMWTRSGGILFLTFEDKPALLLRRVEITIDGDVDTVITKSTKKGRFTFSKSKVVEKVSFDKEHEQLLFDKYGDKVRLSLNKENKGRFYVDKECGLLQFGNVTAIISMELKKELTQCYMDAIDRVDLKLLEQRIKDTK